MVKRMLEGIPLTRGRTDHDLPSLHELTPISMEPFDSQPTGEATSRSEDYLYEPTVSVPITLLLLICPSALHPAPHKFRNHSC